jgi:hypothetical protein
MKKNLFFEYVFARFFVLIDTIDAFFEEVGEKITFLKVALVFFVSWILVVSAPLLCKITIFTVKILDCSPVLIDQKDFNLLMATMFIALFLLLIAHFKENHFLIRGSFYFVLFFFLFSKLAIN